LDIGLEIPLPVFIIVGIFSGWITVTEVAALSLAYVVVAECLIRREVSWQEFKKASLESMVLTGAIFAILVSALAFSNFLVDDQIPQKFLEFLQHYITSKLVFLIFLNIILLITGCLMDVYSAILVMVPLLLPVSKGYGIDPIHFAVIFLWNLEIGYSTPPIGFNLFIGAFRFREPLEALWRAALPRLAVQVLGLLVITYWPGLSLWLPKVLGMRQELIPFNLMGG
jgi:tripartite ATP-independent transporter DctM subunit